MAVANISVYKTVKKLCMVNRSFSIYNNFYY